MILKQQQGSHSCLAVWLPKDSLGPGEAGSLVAKRLMIYLFYCKLQQQEVFTLVFKGTGGKLLDVLQLSDDALVLAVPSLMPVPLHWALGSVPGLSEEIACSKQSHGT